MLHCVGVSNSTAVQGGRVHLLPLCQTQDPTLCTPSEEIKYSPGETSEAALALQLSNVLPGQNPKRKEQKAGWSRQDLACQCSAGLVGRGSPSSGSAETLRRPCPREAIGATVWVIEWGRSDGAAHGDCGSTGVRWSWWSGTGSTRTVLFVSTLGL